MQPLNQLNFIKGANAPFFLFFYQWLFPFKKFLKGSLNYLYPFRSNYIANDKNIRTKKVICCLSGDDKCSKINVAHYSIKYQECDSVAKVIVYSTNTCPYCVMAKDFLKQNNIKYEEINVAQNHEKAIEMIEKSGQQGVPVIDIDGKIIVGFDKSAMKKALHLQ